LILHILRVSSRAQVIPAIIQAVSVNVVYLKVWRDVKYLTVHRNDVVFAVFAVITLRVEGPGIFVPPCAPRINYQCIVIFYVYESYLSLR
jgi:hypothetical protein